VSEYRAVSRRRRTKQIDKFLFLDAAHTVSPSSFFHLFLSFFSPFTHTEEGKPTRACPYLTLPHLTSPSPTSLFLLLLSFLYHCPTYPRGFIIFFSFSLWPLFPFLFFFPLSSVFSLVSVLFLLSWSESNNERK